MTDLLLTLGHNSSAVVMNHDGDVKIGFETERITQKKSDSAFPAAAIKRCRDYSLSFDTAYVTHWQVENDVDKMTTKHWDRSAVPAKQVITQEDLGLTHHDTHAWGALAFAGPEFPIDHTQILVVDGFGNFSEHISIYDVVDMHDIKLRVRFFGYNTSIGLMYQYATSFLGMKMHEDEYKLLGYQSKFNDTFSIAILQEAQAYTHVIMRQWLESLKNVVSAKHDPMISLDALPNTALMWNEHFTKLCKIAGISDMHSFEARVLVAHVAQSFTELAIGYLYILYAPKNLIVSGGVFFNVAVNAALVRIVPGKFCAYPLAGDQGNAIGLRYYHTGKARIDNLFWGWRKSEQFSGNYEDIPGLYYEPEYASAMEIAANAMARNGFVNIVRGDMEFGPRSLCNTSTIAIADEMSIVFEINRINGRNTVMPFAPVVTPDIFAKHFEHGDKVWRSEQFMITALECKDWVWPGAALETMDWRYTGRPQVYLPHQDDVVSTLLDQHGVLINTSFNRHGVPIVLDYEHIIESHIFQHRHNKDVVTIIMD